jgi:putative membrane protein
MGNQMVFAQVEAGMNTTSAGWLMFHLAAAGIFSIVGIVVLFLAIFLMEKLTRFSITKEIVDEHNTALAIIVGAIVIGISIIIAASISG